MLLITFPHTYPYPFTRPTLHPQQPLLHLPSGSHFSGHYPPRDLRQHSASFFSLARLFLWHGIHLIWAVYACMAFYGCHIVRYGERLEHILICFIMLLCVGRLGEHWTAAFIVISFRSWVLCKPHEHFFVHDWMIMHTCLIQLEGLHCMCVVWLNVLVVACYLMEIDGDRYSRHLPSTCNRQQ